VHEVGSPRINPKTGYRDKNHLKWLDIRALVGHFIRPSAQMISDIHYFSAFATWLPSAVGRHYAYVDALKVRDINVVMGQFKAKSRNCKSCGSKWIGHEEKESDVNIAIHLIHQASIDAFDVAYVLSADTDLLPAIRLIKTAFPNKRIEILIPERRFGNALELRNTCHAAKRIKAQHLESSLLPDQLTTAAGVLINRPIEYIAP